MHLEVGHKVDRMLPDETETALQTAATARMNEDDAADEGTLLDSIAWDTYNVPNEQTVAFSDHPEKTETFIVYKSLRNDCTAYVDPFELYVEALDLHLEILGKHKLNRQRQHRILLLTFGNRCLKRRLAKMVIQHSAQDQQPVLYHTASDLLKLCQQSLETAFKWKRHKLVLHSSQSTYLAVAYRTKSHVIVMTWLNGSLLIALLAKHSSLLDGTVLHQLKRASQQQLWHLSCQTQIPPKLLQRSMMKKDRRFP